MSSFFRRIGRDLREGFWGVIRHGAMAMSSASAVMITLCIISIFLIFSFNVDTIASKIEGTVQISVLIDFEYEDSTNEMRIKEEIEAIEGVTKVTFYSKEAEWEYYLNLMEAENAELFKGYGDDNPMHDAYYVDVVEGTYLQEVSSKIQNIEGIFSVDYGGSSAVMLVNALNSIRYGGFILVIALSALAIFLISNTIKLTIYARNREIMIMRNVGASNNYIRSPFVIEGIIIGIIGSLVPIALTIFGYIYLYQELGGTLLTDLFTLIPPHPFVLQISAILLGIGILVGLVGSFLSVTKYLRWKR